MEKSYISQNKQARSLRNNKRPKLDRRWTLLFIGNRGKTITLKHFKGMVILTLLILSVVIAVAAGLFLWNQDIIQEKHELESNLKKLEERMQALRHEKDIIMTRLVVAEAKVQQHRTRLPEKQTMQESIPDKGENDSRERKQNTQPAAQTPEAGEPEPAEPENEDNSSETGLSVAIENFRLTNSTSNNKLKVQFKIKNTSPNSQHVTGHAIVVLKGEQINQSDWLAIPGMPLVEGKPTGRNRGYSFGINYFRTMRFSRSSPKNPDKYEIASLYVFTRSGELLLEQDFDVNLGSTDP
jgi:hypothetical protein